MEVATCIGRVVQPEVGELPPIYNPTSDFRLGKWVSLLASSPRLPAVWTVWLIEFVQNRTYLDDYIGELSVDHKRGLE
jgi:hypothetical protein